MNLNQFLKHMSQKLSIDLKWPKIKPKIAIFLP